jgi:hypothetical protein
MSSDGKSKEMVAYEEQIARDKISIAERLARPNAFSLYDEGAPMGDVLRKLQEIASDEKVGPHMAPTILKGSVYVDGREYTLNEDNNLLVDGAPRSPLPAWWVLQRLWAGDFEPYAGELDGDDKHNMGDSDLRGALLWGDWNRPLCAASHWMRRAYVPLRAATLDEIRRAAGVDALPPIKSRHVETNETGKDGLYYFPYGSTHSTYNFPAERPAEIKYPTSIWKSVGDNWADG